MQMRMDTCCIIPARRNGILFSPVSYILVGVWGFVLLYVFWVFEGEEGFQWLYIRFLNASARE